jgi:hypothetical protein
VYRENTDGAEFLIGYLGKSDGFAVSISEDGIKTSKASLITLRAVENTQN